MTEGVFPKVDGDILYASEVNGFHYGLTTVNQIYTGTDFNASRTTIGTTTNSYEMTVITSAQLVSKTYASIKITFTATSTAGASSSSGYTKLSLQSKYVGGIYGTDFDMMTSAANSTSLENNASTIEYTHILTANEKANGLQLKILGTAVVAGNTHSDTIGNVQTVVELI